MRRSPSLLLALAACGAPAHPAAKPAQLVETARFDHIDATQAREPAIVVHPGGRMFVAGYGVDPHPSLWQSDDHGATWTTVDAGGEGNSDVDLAVAADGTLYFINLTYDHDKNIGRAIHVGASHDAGATWHWTTLSEQPWDDRPWLAVTRDGTAHAVWSNEAGVHHATSHDRGTSWAEGAKVSEHGNSSHLVAGPRGELAVRITPAWGGGMKLTPGFDQIAISTDGGEAWTVSPAPGVRAWKTMVETGEHDTPRWVEPLAWDPRGDLYSLWTAPDGVHLARSRDQARTWTDTIIAHPAATAFFPYLTALGPGALAATWFTVHEADGSDLRWHLARIDGGTIAESAPYTLECAGKHEDSDPKLYNDTCGEYLRTVALGGARIGVVGTIQNQPAERLGFTLWTFELR